MAVLVYQGGSGDLYYSIGVNDVFAGLTWSARALDQRLRSQYFPVRLSGLRRVDGGRGAPIE